jgi:hypothetical protein
MDQERAASLRKLRDDANAVLKGYQDSTTRYRSDLTAYVFAKDKLKDESLSVRDRQFWEESRASHWAGVKLHEAACRQFGITLRSIGERIVLVMADKLLRYPMLLDCLADRHNHLETDWTQLETELETVRHEATRLFGRR